jgi:DNA mismatch repair protein MutS
VVRVVTPGTVIEPGLLHSKVNNYLAAFVSDGRRAGIAYADVTTGEFAATELESATAISEIQRIAPSELLIPHSLEAAKNDLPGFVTICDDDYFDAQRARSALLSHFEARSLSAFGLNRSPLATSAAGAIIAYLRDTQTASAGQLTRLTSYHTGNFMLLDARTLRSLEIFENFDGVPSLLTTLDVTRTAMGGRRLRAWLRQPLLDTTEIMRRHDHVAWFVEHGKARAELFAAFDLVHDLERLSGRVRAGVSSASEVLALGQSLETLPRVRAVLQGDPKRFETLLAAIPMCAEAARVIREAIADELPKRSEGTGIIRTGFSDELDKLRELLRNGKTYLAEMEQRERARTGIKSLRVGYNKVFGHYIEVTRPNLHLVPRVTRASRHWRKPNASSRSNSKSSSRSSSTRRSASANSKRICSGKCAPRSAGAATKFSPPLQSSLISMPSPLSPKSPRSTNTSVRSFPRCPCCVSRRVVIPFWNAWSKRILLSPTM